MMCPSAQRHPSTHFFSDISRLVFANDLDNGMGRLPYLSAKLNYSTPWPYGSTAAIFAHSSAFSFPATARCAGHHRISMTMAGLAFCEAAIHYLARMAYFGPGPGSSEDMARIAACALVKIVSLSGMDCRLAATSRALRSAALSVSKPHDYKRRRVPAPAEEGDAESETSEWVLRERREREKKRRAEAEELGAEVEEPLFLPTPAFMASAEKE
jgi:hypothetical protein